MTTKAKQSILGLEPVSPAQDDLQLYSDPFEMVYNSLSVPERELVDTGRFHILAERAIQVKGVIAARLMSDLSEEMVVIFTETIRELDGIIDRAGQTKSAQYVREFAHRRKQQLTKNLERLEATAVDGMIVEAGRSVYPPNEKERKSRLRRILEAFTRDAEELD
jgi:hypothetical protein